MATYVLIHGAGDVAWYWHLLERELRGRGHDVVAPDLPCEDDSAGLTDYADTVVAGMVPSPGERPEDWVTHTRLEGAPGGSDGRALDPVALFYHDVPPELAAEALRRGRRQSATPGRKPWPLRAWPDVPTRFLLCRDDRVFPAAFMRRVAQERLGITPDEIGGSHCVALSRPGELADRLEAYRAEAKGPSRRPRVRDRSEET